jgi:hypothetical protein
LRRQKPDTFKASSIYDDKKTHEKHPAIDAFDGDHKTAWTEGVDGDGKGEWLEGDFTAPRKVWSILVDTGIVRTSPTSGDLFTENAHAKKLRLQLDDADAFTRDVAADETQVAFEGINRDVQHVRVVADDVYAGSKWHDFGITELVVLVDASTFPSVPESMVQNEVTNVTDGENAKSVLRRFGVNPLAEQFDGRTITASLQKASLVDGSGKERLLQVNFAAAADDDGLQQQDVWLVFLATTDDDRLIGLGSDWISAKAAAPIAVTLEKLHSADADDVVARWSTCDADAGTKGCNAMRAWSGERGFVERIVDVTSDDAPTIGDEPAPPHTLKTTALTLKLDAKSFVYR